MSVSLGVRDAGNVPQSTMVHHQDGNVAYITHGRRIFRLEGDKRERLGTFPRVLPRDFFGWPRLAQRAIRADKCNVFPTSSGRLLGIRANVVFAIEKGTVRPLFSIQGDCALHGGICEDLAGWMYIGEYFMNPERGPVRIWRVSPTLDQWEIAHEFPAGRIRHAHGVFRDPYDDASLWVSTGDLKGECHLVQTKDRFENLIWHGDGGQKWRAVHLFFTPTHVCWMTDSHLEQNYACRMDRATGELELGMKVANPSWYGLTTVEGVHIAGTTVENGPGVTSDRCEILVSDDAFHWQSAMSYLKDPYKPLNVFKFGVITFPSGRVSSKKVLASGEAMVGFEGMVKAFEITGGAA